MEKLTRKLRPEAKYGADLENLVVAGELDAAVAAHARRAYSYTYTHFWREKFDFCYRSRLLHARPSGRPVSLQPYPHHLGQPAGGTLRGADRSAADGRFRRGCSHLVTSTCCAIPARAGERPLRRSATAR